MKVKRIDIIVIPPLDVIDFVFEGDVSEAVALSELSEGKDVHDLMISAAIIHMQRLLLLFRDVEDLKKFADQVVKTKEITDFLDLNKKVRICGKLIR